MVSVNLYPRLPVSFEKPYLIILGAGASTAVTNGDFPTDDTFLSRIRKSKNSPYLNPTIIQLALDYLGIGEEDRASRSFEEAWSAIDDAYNNRDWLPCNGEILAKFERQRQKIINLEIEKRQRRYYSRRVRKGATAEELFTNAGWECQQGALGALREIPNNATLSKFLDRIPFLKERASDCAVISFNYDLLLETACGNANIPFVDYPLDYDPTKALVNPKDSLILLKPHGSLNWKRRDKGERDIAIARRADALELRETGYLTANAPVLVQPMIIGLRPKGEHEPKAETDTVLELFRAIREACTQLIAAAQKIFIVGYRFPPADRYFRNLLMDAQSARERPLGRIQFIGLGGGEEYWARLLRHLFWTSSNTEVSIDLSGF